MGLTQRGAGYSNKRKQFINRDVKTIIGEVKPQLGCNGQSNNASNHIAKTLPGIVAPSLLGVPSPARRFTKVCGWQTVTEETGTDAIIRIVAPIKPHAPREKPAISMGEGLSMTEVSGLEAKESMACDTACPPGASMTTLNAATSPTYGLSDAFQGVEMVRLLRKILAKIRRTSQPNSPFFLLLRCAEECPVS
jgi:hypothetical protein